MKTLVQIWLSASVMYSLSLVNLVAQPGITNHFDISAGLSTTEAINIGVRYNFGQNSIGLNAGMLPTSRSWRFISSFSYYRHFWGYSNRNVVWTGYLKAAGHYTYSNAEFTQGNISIKRVAGARLYAGHDFNLTSRLNFSTALGPMLVFFDYPYGTQRRKHRLLAGMDLSIFYRL